MGTEKKQPRQSTKHYLALGETTPKRVTPRPKDWSFKKPIEGRVGKGKRTRIRLKERGWTVADLNAHLADVRAGLPDCRWTITCNQPARRLTATDYLYIRSHAFSKPHDVIAVKYNDDSRVLELLDMHGIIPSEQEEKPLGAGMLDS